MSEEITKNVESKEEISITINDAFQEYVKQLPKKNKRNAQSDVAKFIRWIGGERLTSSIVPSEIGEYNENFGPKNTSRDLTDRITSTKEFFDFYEKERICEVKSSDTLKVA